MQRNPRRSKVLAKKKLAKSLYLENRGIPFRGMVARDESPDYRWLHCETESLTKQRIQEAEQQGRGFFGGLSPPVFHGEPRENIREMPALSLRIPFVFPIAEHALQHEIKWAGYPDEEYAMFLFTVIIKRYASHVAYLEFLTYWLNRTSTGDIREAMLKHLQRLPTVRALNHSEMFRKDYSCSSALTLTLPLPGRQDVFDKGDIVALLGKHRRKLPHALRNQRFFKLVELSVPSNVHFVPTNHEPKWAKVQACDRQGVLVQDAPVLPICLSWLDPQFAVSPNDDEETRVANGDATYEPDVLQHRIEVRSRPQTHPNHPTRNKKHFRIHYLVPSATVGDGPVDVERRARGVHRLAVPSDSEARRAGGCVPLPRTVPVGRGAPLLAQVDQELHAGQAPCRGLGRVADGAKSGEQAVAAYPVAGHAALGAAGGQHHLAQRRDPDRVQPQNPAPALPHNDYDQERGQPGMNKHVTCAISLVPNPTSLAQHGKA